MVGPCAWDPPAEPPGWLERIERPIVLVTSSSEFQDDGRLVQAALDGLAGEDVEVVATVPSQDQDAFRAPRTPGSRASCPTILCSNARHAR